VVAFEASEAQALVLFDANRTRLHIVAATEPVRGTDVTRTICRVDSARIWPSATLGERFPATHSIGSTPEPDTRLSRSARRDGGRAETAVSYAAERLQFGVPIGSFQAVQQLASDQLVSLEGARSLTEYAAWAVDESDVDTPSSPHFRPRRTAPARAARSVKPSSRSTRHGNHMDCMAHVYLRRALLDALLLGINSKQILDLTIARRRRAA